MQTTTAMRRCAEFNISRFHVIRRTVEKMHVDNRNDCPKRVHLSGIAPGANVATERLPGP